MVLIDEKWAQPTLRHELLDRGQEQELGRRLREAQLRIRLQVLSTELGRSLLLRQLGSDAPAAGVAERLIELARRAWAAPEPEAPRAAETAAAEKLLDADRGLQRRVDEVVERWFRVAPGLAAAAERPAPARPAAPGRLASELRWRAGSAELAGPWAAAGAGRPRPTAGRRAAAVAGLLRALHRIEPDRRAFLQAREQLVLCNQRLVLQQVRRYQDQGVAAGDLVQEGNLGLVRAAERFDHRLGFRFSTYAIWWIRQALMRAVSEQSGDIRHPYNQFERYGKVHKASRQFVQMHGRDPRPEEIEELSGLDAAQIASTLEAGRAVASLQQPTGEEKDRPLSSFIADTEGESPCAQVERRERLAQLERSLEELPERESRILRLRYGLGHEREHTLDEIGHQFDLTRERIRQLEARALERLRLPHHARLRECLELAG